jgi:hypothetical protein
VGKRRAEHVDHRGSIHPKQPGELAKRWATSGVFDLGLAAVLDAFQTANELAEMSGISGERFDVKIVCLLKSVKTSRAPSTC